MSQKTVAPHGLTVTQAKDINTAELRLQADAVIVGSGAGGAVAAFELARAGLSVIVLEAGPYVPSREFTEDLSKAMVQLYQDKGTQANADGDMLVLQGRCVGGSTVVNACAAFRTPDFILEEWRQQHGLTQLTQATLAPYFSRVETNLAVHVNSENEINQNSQVLTEGCRKLGVSWKPFSRNTLGCAATGHCLSGCASDRKQSMLVTYLPWAVAHGAQIFADTCVTEVLTEGGKATGVQAKVVDPSTGVTKARMVVQAKTVVLAAGAVQTPLLLQASSIANSSGQVGKNFACHPSAGVTGEYPHDIHPWRGALMGIYIDEWMHPSKGGFLLECGSGGPVEMATALQPGLGKPFMEYMAKAKKMATIVTLIHDQNVGSVQWNKQSKTIDYQVSPHDATAIKASLKAAAKVHFASGATRVYLPTVAPVTIEQAQDINAMVDAIEVAPHTLRLVSYHPQGTCRMGADPRRSVVGPQGESHDVKGLYITDASIFPSSIIVNPQITVYALATYIAEQIVKNVAKG
jgi:choline dehydrogenase-like flavoprotein